MRWPGQVPASAPLSMIYPCSLDSCGLASSSRCVARLPFALPVPLLPIIDHIAVPAPLRATDQDWRAALTAAPCRAYSARGGVRVPHAHPADRAKGAARRMVIEGTIVSKEPGLTAVFGGVEQPYVRCVIARLDDPERHAEARVVGVSDVPVPVGGQTIGSTRFIMRGRVPSRSDRASISAARTLLSRASVCGFAR